MLSSYQRPAGAIMFFDTSLVSTSFLCLNNSERVAFEEVSAEVSSTAARD